MSGDCDKTVSTEFENQVSMVNLDEGEHTAEGQDGFCEMLRGLASQG